MGAIVGDGSDVLIDAERAVLLDGLDVCLVNAFAGDEPGRTRLAMRLDGRVNKTTDRASILYILDEDGAAAIVTELVALASRVGPEFATLFQTRLEKLAAEDQI